MKPTLTPLSDDTKGTTMKNPELSPAQKFDRLFTSLIRVPKAEIDKEQGKIQKSEDGLIRSGLSRRFQPNRWCRGESSNLLPSFTIIPGH